MSPTRRALAVALALGVLVAGAGCSEDDDPRGNTGPTSTTAPRFGAGVDSPAGPREPDPVLAVTTLSSRPETVTGGDALVQVEIPPEAETDDLRVLADDEDVTDVFSGGDEARTGLVTDLPVGSTEIRAELGEMVATVEVVNHPATGPVISGPHLPLLACSTEAMGLGPATDDDCSAPTKVDYRYVTTAGALADLPDPAARPADLATAVIGGERVPLIVRRERGVINRGVYTFTVVDPTPGQPSDEGDGGDDADPPTGPGAAAAADLDGLAWNDRLVWRFGGGCGTTYAQGADGATAEDPALLARGYAVGSSTFTSFQTHCNDVLAAETLAMVKEHIVESLGPVEATIGQGSSGGAIQQHLIVQNYPGLLDAAAAGQPFPDAVSISPGVSDCALLARYYATPEGAALDEFQRTVINGHATQATCGTWNASFVEALRPSDGCPAVPDALRYDPDLRRTGIRCTLADANVNTLGVDPTSGFANRPLDNLGVQYGLNALNTGLLDVDEFLSLNEAVGGFDVDGGFSPARTSASPETIAAAYAGGRVATGGGDLRIIPLIDVNTFTDPSGDIHDRVRAFSLRDRLRLPDGRPAPNHVIWTRRPTDPVEPATDDVPVATDVMTRAVVALDEWVTAVADDEVGGNRAEIVARTRPEDVADECLDAAGEPVRGDGIYEDGGACAEDFPIAGDPRIAAGERRADDLLKCTLKPVDPADYQPTLTLDQLDRLQRIFPAGVCDWSARGVGQLDPFGTWQSYADGLPFDPARLLELDEQSGVTGRDDDPDAG